MAHPEQNAFFADISARFPEYFESTNKILEIGSQNINGSVRHFFPNAQSYLGIDLCISTDVDWTVPGQLIELPDGWAEVAISTECFEHCKDWEKVMINMIRITDINGMILMTCASTGRATHGTIDSDVESSPFTSDYYKNLNIDDINKIQLNHYFSRYGFEINNKSHDLYFWGIRSKAKILEGDSYWGDIADRLARTQGQLAQAVRRHTVIKEEADKSKSEADKAHAQVAEYIEKAEKYRIQAEEYHTRLIEIEKYDHDIKNRKPRIISNIKIIILSLFKWPIVAIRKPK